MDVITLKALIKELEERVIDLEAEYKMCGHPAICNRISECNDIISLLRNKVYEINPVECDW